MNCKERIRTTLMMEEPDIVPISACFVPEIEKTLRLALEIKADDIGVSLGNDMILLPHGYSTGYYLNEDNEYEDEWGCTWRYFINKTGAYPEVIKRPLEDINAFESYQIPDASDDMRYQKDQAMIEQYGNQYWMVGSIPCSIFEAAWGLRGLDTLLMDMVDNKEFVHALMDKVMQFPLIAGKKLIDLGVDMLWTGDDISMQTGMIMSLNMWREFLKPRYAYMFSEFKKQNPNVKIAYHSCGNCEQILEDMIEIGLDVINPIQPKSMDPIYIKHKYGDRLCLWGGMDVQYILPLGSADDVKKEVKRLVTHLGKGGGYILAPAHNIQSDTSINNIMAFYKAAKQYGKYPLK